MKNIYRSLWTRNLVGLSLVITMLISSSMVVLAAPGNALAGHLKEMEAESYAHQAFAAYGMRMPAKITGNTIQPPVVLLASKALRSS